MARASAGAPPPEPEYDETLFPTVEEREEALTAWDEGKEEAERGNPIGTFQARIAVAELGRSSSSNRLQIHYELEILVGEHQGIIIHKYDGLATAKQSSITQQQLKRLGVDISGLTLELLPAQLLELVDVQIVLATRQNEEFYNIYFQRRMSPGVAQGAPESAASAAPGAKPAAATASRARTRGRATATAPSPTGRKF